MARADAAQVRALVAAYVPGGDAHRALALHADADWSGPTELEAGGRHLRVVPCRAPISVREALATHDDDRLLVILTPCTGTELGLDVRARLVKGDVLPLDPFTSVLAVFGARTLDPQLVPERWLIDDLIRLAPALGWQDRLPLGGVLDLATGWRSWHDARLHLVGEPADVASVLEACARPEVAAALAGLDPEYRHRLGLRWAETTGFAAAPLLADLSAHGNGGALAALGAVAGVLWAPTDRSDLAQLQILARARLEDRFGRDQLDATTARSWAAAASETFNDVTVGAVADLAERELARADATTLAELSDIMPTGFELRLAALADGLRRGDLDAAGAALEDLRRHRLAPRREHRIRTAEAAIRLFRRQQHPAPRSVCGFAAAAAVYAAEGAFVDEAVQLLCDGDAQPDLAAISAELATAAEAEQQRASADFVRQLVEWSRSEPAPDERIMPLEHLLDAIVTPVARDAPALLVVADGMSLAVAHQLLGDLREEGWAHAAPETRDGWPVGIALLPTVTEVSRASLLTGGRRVGGQAEERAGFAAHRGLRSVSTATRPPVLFHKAALVGPSGLALPDEVRAQVADPGQRVVGVVVNSVDDHLARGDQLRVGWDLASLRPLGWLLDAAAEAGRVVVLTADHGHVLHHRGATVRQMTAGGERWRPAATGAANEAEVELSGPRVLLADGHVVLPADERLRYGGHKHGYHGGATPQEVLVPVAVLARLLPAGWRHLPLAVPAWWDDQPVPVSAPPVVIPPTPAEAIGAIPRLFDPEPARAAAPASVSADSWVDRLLASPSFTAHRARVRLPRPIPDFRFREYLVYIDGNGGTMPLQALSTRTGEPPDTLRMALSLVQRLINLDGAEILAVRSDGTIELNRELAVAQFELAAG